MYIVGGRILTMAGREIPEGILQIRNGKIAQVGARGEVKLQPEEGEQVVIAKNALIMPGIIWVSWKKKRARKGMTVMRQWIP